MVAGEASGDIYGAGLAGTLKSKVPDLQIAGMGGDQMSASGVRLLFHHRQVSVVGIFEVASKLRHLRQAYRNLLNWVEEQNPDFAVLIDFPDFNFRLARVLKQKRIKTFYFISPQIWAWRKNRIGYLKDHIDLMISILPFEKRIYESAGVPCVYTGHPLVEIVREELETQPSFPKPANPANPLIGIMPGSRDVEVRRHLPVLMQTLESLRRKMDFDTLLLWAPSLSPSDYAIPESVTVIRDNRYAAMKSCDFMLVASGTSTLEAAILGTPFLIVYRVGKLSWQLGKVLVRVPYYGLVNWIAQRKCVPEFIQNQMNPETLSAEAFRYLQDADARTTMKSDLAGIVDQLGPPGAMNRAAEAILAHL